MSLDRAFLEKGIGKLLSVLSRHGFGYVKGEDGVSMSTYSTGFLRSGALEIRLIVRCKNELGCPGYTEGIGIATHFSLLRTLGYEDKSKLVDGFLSCSAKDGGDPFDALLSDLQDLILPTLETAPADFSSALARAVALDKEPSYW